MYTAYELMRRRFGERIRKLTAGTFLLLRALAEGVRVFAISIIVAIVLIEPASQHPPWSFLRGSRGEIASILVIVALTLFYTFEGGMTAVIWTDVVQMFLYVAGAVLSFFVILHQIPGGWTHVYERGERGAQIASVRFPVFVDCGFLRPKLQLLGRPHRRVFPHHRQPRHRAVAGPAAAGSQKRGPEPRGAISSWVVIFFQFALFLLIGTLLFVHYSDTHLRGAAAARVDVSQLRLAQPPAWCGRSGDRGDPGGGHVEPERGPERARVHHCDGLLQAACHPARPGQDRGSFPGHRAMGDHRVGRDPCSW